MTETSTSWRTVWNPLNIILFWGGAILFAQSLKSEQSQKNISYLSTAMKRMGNRTTTTISTTSMTTSKHWAPNAENHTTPNAMTTTPWTLSKDLKIVLPKHMILINSSLLWCPNAKAGTTTVYSLLERNGIGKGFLREEDGRCFSHCPVSAWKVLKNWTSHKPLSFVIVRNPYERIVSGFRDKIVTGKIRVKQKGIPDFVEFVRYAKEHPSKNIHWEPLSSRCLTGKFQYDYILKMEDKDFTRRLEDIFQVAGMPLSAGIESKNVKEKTSTTYEFYADAAEKGNLTVKELVSLVGNIYGDDIERFGYSFPWEK